MLNHKKYIDIQAFQTKYADAFHIGDDIQITEKVDGSNAFIAYDKETDSLICGSRKHILNENMTLDNFFEFVKRLNKELFKRYEGYYIYGEWNLKHLIKYPEDKIKDFWVFDVYDINNAKWMPQDFSQQMAKDCGLKYVPIFYRGPFISWDHVQSFIGRSDMGATQGEGIVIKNQSNLNNPSSREPFTVKLVCAQYKERMNKPPKEPLSADELAKREYNINLAKTVVTEARVEKLLYKMITEDGLIPRDWDSNHMSIIARNLPSAVYHDCVKEANDVVEQVDNFGKICGKITMDIVRDLLTKQ